MINVDINISGEPYAAKTSFVLNCSRALYVGIAKLSNIKAYREHAASVLDDESYPCYPRRNSLISYCVSEKKSTAQRKYLMIKRQESSTLRTHSGTTRNIMPLLCTFSAQRRLAHRTWRGPGVSAFALPLTTRSTTRSIMQLQYTFFALSCFGAAHVKELWRVRLHPALDDEAGLGERGHAGAPSACLALSDSRLTG